MVQMNTLVFTMIEYGLTERLNIKYHIFYFIYQPPKLIPLFLKLFHFTTTYIKVAVCLGWKKRRNHKFNRLTVSQL